MKYVDPSANNMIWLCESRTDYMIFRYGEILLNMAEAAYELGKDGEALEFVNQIRKRAGINKLTSIDLDKIKHERKVELALKTTDIGICVDGVMLKKLLHNGIQVCVMSWIMKHVNIGSNF